MSSIIFCADGADNLADAQLHYKEDANVLVDHGDRLFRAKVLFASGDLRLVFKHDLLTGIGCLVGLYVASTDTARRGLAGDQFQRLGTPLLRPLPWLAGQVRR